MVGHNLVIDVVFFAIPEPKNEYTTWTMENANENIIINLEEGSPENVKKYFTATKLQNISHHKYLARLEMFDIQASEDDLNVHFRITNFLKYSEEVFHLVIRVSDNSDLETVKTVFIALLGMFFAVGAFINFVYCIKGYVIRSNKTHSF